MLSKSIIRQPLRGASALSWLSLAVAVALLWGLSAPASAQDARVVAEVLHLHGAAEVRRGDARKAANPGQELRQGDVVITHAQGRVRIRFADGSTMALGPQTEVRLTEVTIGDAGNGGVIDLLLGIIRATLRRAERPDGFEVRSRTAVAAVRSTDWIVVSETDTTGVFVVDGAVAVTDEAGAGEVVLTPGEGTDVAADGLPQTPKQWGAPRVEKVLGLTYLP